MPTNSAPLELTEKKSARESRAEPNVKSAKTPKLFNAGVSGKSETAKSADPICYDAATVNQDRMETKMKPLWKKGDVVTIYQLCTRRGLMVEGKATVLKSLDGDYGHEHYMVRFHGKTGKPSLGQEYERFIDRDGQTGDPQDYIKAFNERIGYKAA
jgi:hypothetical protein